jgi:hypothetical protein
MTKTEVIEKDVLKLLVKRVRDREGQDHFFKVKHLDLPYDNYMIGKACAKLMRKNLVVRVNSVKSSAVYKTCISDLCDLGSDYVWEK